MHEHCMYARCLSGHQASMPAMHLLGAIRLAIGYIACIGGFILLPCPFVIGLESGNRLAKELLIF